MRCKEFIELFVPPIYYKVKKRLFPKKQPVHHPLPKVEHEKMRMVVIGNGPSLNKTVELYLDQLLEADCIMVNFSARTPLFEQIRPAYYLMTDPGFFDEDDMPFIEALINDLRSKTSWPMTIVMPDFMKSWDKCSDLLQNDNIKILYYNNHWCNFPKEKLFEAWDANRIDPPGQTVLNTAVWLSIYWGYNETYIVGADTSFLEDTHVEQETNRVYTIDSHFYPNEDVFKNLNVWNENKRYLPYKFHEEIETIYIILKSYWELKAYADWKGVKVYNASEYSCIDAFERKKLK